MGARACNTSGNYFDNYFFTNLNKTIQHGN